ncbi:Hydroxyacylglutathione hydrolase, mitochondrial [Armadillidium nasatum]|uniref:hydroxyacylglutathione hydrolase n=1 Tax=Armadillidium nasatum TaxID=96803 RepID=A0A5N5TP04_9CRUS|nr:Hydroxyacylglutathione hydrolase, mitochondrial [Armadillidium nasatum]
MFRVISSVLPERAVQGITAAYFKANSWYNLGSGKFHSTQELVTYSKMKVNILPALSDNYMYLLIDDTTKEAAIVDPVEPKTVIKAVEDAGGNSDLVAQFPSKLKVLGGDDRINALTQKVSHGDTLSVGSLKIDCLFTPCHTQGHICYHVTNTEDPSDTLFLGGCGKFFEGNATEMHRALIEILGTLPDNTHVYCGHEYAINNLLFGLHVEPNNAVLQEKLKWVKQRRKDEKPSVPSTIGEEKQINPFMRVNEPTVQQHTKTEGAVETMAALRAEKDKFKPPVVDL